MSEAPPRGRAAFAKRPRRSRARAIARARTAVELSTADDELAERLVDLLCDLRHLAAAERVSFERAEARARAAFEAECAGPRVSAPEVV